MHRRILSNYSNSDLRQKQWVELSVRYSLLVMIDSHDDIIMDTIIKAGVVHVFNVSQTFLEIERRRKMK